MPARCNNQQKARLLHYMESYTETLLCSLNEESKPIWQQIMDELNNMSDKFKLDAKGWREHWSKWKNNVSSKYKRVLKSKKTANPTDLEKRVLVFVHGNVETTFSAFAETSSDSGRASKRQCLRNEIENSTPSTSTAGTVPPYFGTAMAYSSSLHPINTFDGPYPVAEKRKPFQPHNPMANIPLHNEPHHSRAINNPMPSQLRIPFRPINKALLFEPINPYGHLNYLSKNISSQASKPDGSTSSPSYARPLTHNPLANTYYDRLRNKAPVGSSQPYFDGYRPEFQPANHFPTILHNLKKPPRFSLQPRKAEVHNRAGKPRGTTCNETRLLASTSRKPLTLSSALTNNSFIPFQPDKADNNTQSFISLLQHLAREPGVTTSNEPDFLASIPSLPAHTLVSALTNDSSDNHNLPVNMSIPLQPHKSDDTQSLISFLQHYAIEPERTTSNDTSFLTSTPSQASLTLLSSLTNNSSDNPNLPLNTTIPMQPHISDSTQSLASHINPLAKEPGGATANDTLTASDKPMSKNPFQSDAYDLLATMLSLSELEMILTIPKPFEPETLDDTTNSTAASHQAGEPESPSSPTSSNATFFAELEMVCQDFNLDDNELTSL